MLQSCRILLLVDFFTLGLSISARFLQYKSRHPNQLNKSEQEIKEEKACANSCAQRTRCAIKQARLVSFPVQFDLQGGGGGGGGGCASKGGGAMAERGAGLRGRGQWLRGGVDLMAQRGEGW